MSAGLVALALAVAVAACGSSNSSSSSGGSTSTATGGASDQLAKAQAALAKYQSAPTKIGITTPLKSAPPAGKTLVMLATNDPNNVLLQKSYKQLASLVHWNYSQVSYDPANPATFGAAVDTALTKKPDYIAEAGIPLTPALLDKVKKAGAKWVLTAVYPAEVKPPVLTVNNAYEHDALMGKMLADFFVADSKGKGNAVMEHVPAYPILGAFSDSFQKEVAALCPDCSVKVVNITIPDLVAGKVPSRMVSELRKNPKTNYLVFDVGPFANGVQSALAAAGLANKVKIIGEAADDAAIAAIKAGTNTAWTGFDTVYSTYQGMDAMLRDSEGMNVEQPKQRVMPTQLLTKATVGDIKHWSEPADALDQFKKLWKIG